MGEGAEGGGGNGRAGAQAGSAELIVFLVDVDNTLIDNDRAKAALDAEIRTVLPRTEADGFWRTYEEVRREYGVVDYVAVLARLAVLLPPALHAEVERAVLHFPYERYLYPGALAVLARLHELGTLVILSDGDSVYQPAKIVRSGIAAAAMGNVLVFAHKEESVAEILRAYPAERYVAIDDKAAVLAALRERIGARMFTIHVLQGHYASAAPDAPPPDRVVAAIGDLRSIDPAQLSRE